jgi:DnaJ-class molecular chaperone
MTNSPNDDCVKCDKCRGNGWVEMRIPLLGRGIYEIACGECRGHGYVTRTARQEKSK